MDSENEGDKLEGGLGDEIRASDIQGVEIQGDDTRDGTGPGNETDEIQGSKVQSVDDVRETADKEPEHGKAQSDNDLEQVSPAQEMGQIESQQLDAEDEMAGEIPSIFEISPDIDGPSEYFDVPDEPEVTPMPASTTPLLSAAAMSPSKILSSPRVPSQKTASVVSESRPRRRVAEHVVLYKKAAKVVQNPLSPDPKVCPKQEVTVWRYAGPDRALDIERATLDQYKSKSHQVWSPNTTATDPTRARRWLDSPRGIRGKSTEDWKFEEKRTKERRDHELALELGYETLVGNLLYIDIPHTKDIHRSWQNYLSQDKMDWGFPYYKGSIERPRMRQPEPYLAQQVVEKLWKYPKARMTRSVTEDQDLSTS